MLTGLYPGVFFVRLSKYYTARQLFLSVPFGYGTNWYRLVPWSSQSYCLDVQNGSNDNGNLLQLYPCTGGLNQMFFGVPVIAS